MQSVDDEHSPDYCPPEDETHECIDHLLIQQHEWIEPHGEPCFQQWWVCTWCDETFTEQQVDELIAKEAK